MKILDLGCGRRKTPGAIGIDKIKLPEVDVVHDLNKFPYPFEDNYFHKIIAKNIIEHLWDTVKVMEELYRILKPNGILYIEVPIFPNPCCFRDPTHVRYFEKDSFDFFCPDTDLGRENMYCTKARFKIKNKTTDNWGPNLYITLEAIK